MFVLPLLFRLRTNLVILSLAHFCLVPVLVSICFSYNFSFCNLVPDKLIKSVSLTFIFCLLYRVFVSFIPRAPGKGAVYSKVMIAKVSVFRVSLFWCHIQYVCLTTSPMIADNLISSVPRTFIFYQFVVVCDPWVFSWYDPRIFSFVWPHFSGSVYNC